MLKKVRGLLDTRELIETLNRGLESQSGKIDGLSRDISSVSQELLLLRKEISGAKKIQSGVFYNFEKELGKFSDQRKKLKHEIKDFNIFKRDIREKIFETAKKDIQKGIEILNDDLNDYKSLKKDIISMGKELDGLLEEIVKFRKISANIKEKDFEMVSFSNQVMKMEKEKLDLMRKIDSMERLVSRMRRR